MTDTTHEIERIVDDQENAIRERHPDKWEKYMELRDAYVDSTGGRDVEQTQEQLPVKRYLMSSSYIAARFALEGNLGERDKAAQSCSILLSSFGHEPMAMMEKHIRCEQLWTRSFHQERPPASVIAMACLPLLVIGGILAGIVFWIAF